MATTANTDFFQVAPVSGSTADLRDLFHGKKVVVDPKFQKFVRKTVGPRFNLRTGFGCRVSPLRCEHTSLGTHGAYFVDGHEVCALLVHLAGTGSDLLNISPGKDEMNIVLGHAEFEGEDLVFYIEHEVVGDEDQIHVHAEPAEHVEDGPTRVIYFS